MGYKALVDAACQAITEYTAAALQAKINAGENIQIVDVRDIRELWREGKITKAYHAPRGMIEFWVDPNSPYHKPLFADQEKTYIFYCAAGWRSALAAKAAKDCGMTNAAHLIGGFAAWRELGGDIETVEQRP